MTSTSSAATTDTRVSVRIGGGKSVHYSTGLNGRYGAGTQCGTVGKPGVAVHRVSHPVTCAKCLR